MDIEAYRLRTNKTVAELADLLGVKQAAIYNYKYGKSKPSYESIEKMLLDGAYLSEIFDESVQAKVAESIVPKQDGGFAIPERFDTPEFKESVAKVLRELKSVGKI